MFSVGEKVIYGTQGVCTIKEITTKKFCSETHKYYVLTPLKDVHATAYVPMDNEISMSKMHSVLTREQIDKLLETINGTIDWIEDDDVRKEFCSSAIKGGNREELIEAIGMLYMRRKDLSETKKHLHSADERFLREAEKLLNDEFSFALGISEEDVPKYIRSRIKSRD